jgi:short-subunit dehydrogenase
MVTRKRGNVVAICSLSAKVTVPCAVAYCSTKFGLDGFMEALYDEICFLKQDFIKLTTVYPSYMNTSTNLEKVYRKIGNVHFIKTENAANLIVKAMLVDKRKIYIPQVAKLTMLIK